MSNPAAFLSRAREVLAKMDRDAHGFPSPLPWYVSGERSMIWADDGDALVSISAIDETPYIEPPVAALAVLAVNSLAALCDVVEALAIFRRANDAAWVTLSEGPGGTAAEAETETWLLESEAVLDAALARLEVPE